MEEVDEEDVVLSDLHMEIAEQDDSPVRVSRYTMQLPAAVMQSFGFVSNFYDAQGDGFGGGSDSESDRDDDDEAIVRRRRGRKRAAAAPDRFHVTLRHHMATPLSLVGLQLWKGALLLCDYLLTHPPGEPQPVLVELGAGIGLASIVAALLWDRVYLTDYSDEILEVAEHNVSANSHLLRNLGREADVPDRVLVRQYNWQCSDNEDPVIAARHGHEALTAVRHAWTAEDAETLSGGRSVLFVAADVIYDDKITNALFHKLTQVMLPGETLIMTLERRVNFSIEDMAVVAQGYSAFMRWIHHLPLPHEASERPPAFRGERLEIDFPQCVEGYERTNELELWRIVKL